MSAVPSLKIVVTGGLENKGYNKVGKTSLCERFAKDKFSLDTQSTLFSGLFVKNIDLEYSSVKLQINDSYRAMNGRVSIKNSCSNEGACYRDASGYIVVFDLTKEESFTSAKKEVADIKKNFPETSIVLVGNKSDLRHLREINNVEAQNYAKNEGIEYIETSAYSGDNVYKLFQKVANLALDKSFPHIKRKREAEIKAANDFSEGFKNDLNSLLETLKYKIQYNYFGYQCESKAHELLQPLMNAEGFYLPADVKNELNKIYDKNPEIARVSCVNDFLIKYADNSMPNRGCMIQ